MVCFTASSSRLPRNLYTISSFTHTVGGSAARWPDTSTSSESSFCLFFARMATTSVAVQAPRATRRSSIDPGASFEDRSESSATIWPEGVCATNRSLPTHCTRAVCICASIKTVPRTEENSKPRPFQKPGRIGHPKKPKQLPSIDIQEWYYPTVCTSQQEKCERVRHPPIGSSTPAYDADGNVTNDFLHTYAWDAYGRPIK